MKLFVWNYSASCESCLASCQGLRKCQDRRPAYKSKNTDHIYRFIT